MILLPNKQQSFFIAQKFEIHHMLNSKHSDHEKHKNLKHL